MGKYKQTLQRVSALAVIIGAILAPGAFTSLVLAAPTYSSPTYGVDEVFMGSGGVNDMSSATYKGRASLGDLGIGNSASTTYQAYGGFTTTPDPYIEMAVTTTNVDLGYLSTSATSFTTNTFTVRTYLASGYVVVNAANPPTNTSPLANVLNALSSPTAPAIGTEQFGINLVLNNSPAVSGSADPVQIPSGSFSNGAAQAGYNTANVYKYVKGDTIAGSTTSSGVTQYTISYMYNISSNTPSGQYNFNHIIVATSTY
jgi:hypothetical protein